ncbi:MAG TPA: alkaline phosphatase family protein, partial [Anaerolineae bacterium]
MLFFIDAFGWRFYAQHADRYPFLQHFARQGVVSKLTSQFPSTTAAHVTTIHTGLAPAQSGVYEWYQYEPVLNTLITPLMFNLAGDQTRDTLSTEGLTAADIFPSSTVYESLAKHGVKGHAFQSNLFAHSIPSKHLLRHASTIPFKTWPEALVHLAQHLARQDGPAYYVLYFSNIDTLCHEFGPNSAEVEAELDSFFITMERLLLDRLSGKYPRTLVMLTADHGMADISPATTVYLNQRKDLHGLGSMLALNRTGAPLVPAGSSR